MVRPQTLVRLPFRAQPSVLRTSVFKAVSAVTLMGAFASVGLIGCPSGGVGDPCVPEDEYKEDFSGFTLNDEFIESRSFQCKTRICLVNHFQGRVSCEKGQAPPKFCDFAKNNDEMANSDCESGETCEKAGAIFTDCDPTPCNESGANPNNCNDPGTDRNPACSEGVCDPDGKFCQCNPAEQAFCPDGYSCDNETAQCVTAVCTVTEGEGSEDKCFVPGTKVPIATSVCAQCSSRPAADTVYCSCRCGIADGEKEDPDDNFNFCECPEGFVCSEVRPNVGLGDVQLTGKYCIKDGTEYIDETKTSCGPVVTDGFLDTSQCDGSKGGA